MRHLLACLAILAAFNVTAQASTIWNPDANGDGLVGASDLLPFLEVFGNSFTATPLYCQDTSVYEAHFVFDPPNGNYAQTQVVSAELASVVVVSSENTQALSNAYMQLVLPIDSVPVGYTMKIIKATSGASLEVILGGDGGQPSLQYLQSTTCVFFNGRWYAH